MIYGMYLSATGVMTNAYRQDVISNNLANAETVGFKKDLATFRQRPMASQEIPRFGGYSSALMDRIGGGAFASPTLVDSSQGDLETTDNPMDVAIMGNGFFSVAGKDGQTCLTRDGHFQFDRAGHLTLANDQGNPVLDAEGHPITLNSAIPAQIMADGRIQQAGKTTARLGLVDVADPASLQKEGGNLLSCHGDLVGIPNDTRLQAGSVERANVDPASELSQLMDTQRQLEANANMIRYQDQTLDKLINDAAKIT